MLISLFIRRLGICILKVAATKWESFSWVKLDDERGPLHMSLSVDIFSFPFSSFPLFNFLAR